MSQGAQGGHSSACPIENRVWGTGKVRGCLMSAEPESHSAQSWLCPDLGGSQRSQEPEGARGFGGLAASPGASCGRKGRAQAAWPSTPPGLAKPGGPHSTPQTPRAWSLVAEAVVLRVGRSYLWVEVGSERMGRVMERPLPTGDQLLRQNPRRCSQHTAGHRGSSAGSRAPWRAPDLAPCPSCRDSSFVRLISPRKRHAPLRKDLDLAPLAFWPQHSFCQAEAGSVPGLVLKAVSGRPGPLAFSSRDPSFQQSCLRNQGILRPLPVLQQRLLPMWQ